MTTLYILSYIALSFSISLGVGSSTIAVLNFFRAIADGTIDESERRMMGVTYIILRVAMVAILIFFTVQLMYGYLGFSDLLYGNTAAVAVGFLVTVLYTNAILMTYRIMPSTFGPAIQASSWYTLGVVAALVSLRITDYPLAVFFLSYVCALLLFTSAINLEMFRLKHKHRPTPTV